MAGGWWSADTAVWMAAAAVLWPLVLGLAAFWRVTARAAVRLCPLAALPALLLAANHREAWVIDVPWLLLGTRVGLDLTGRVFLLLAALVWSCAGMAAPAAVRDDASRGRFAAFFLLSMAGSLGLPLARDAASFYVLFALMSLSAYGLVAHRGDAAARRAGRAYITFAITGEVLLVSGLFVAVWSAGTTSLDDLPARMLARPGGLAAVPLILLGCGMKAGAVPLHPWLPVSYAAAPLPGAVALAGTMSKAGVLGWVRLLPLGHASLVEWSVPVVLLGIAATFYGVAAGLCQREAKVALAYSSVSQMGFLSAAVGLGLVTPSGWNILLPAVLVYTLHHGLTKSALFLTIAVPGSAAAARTQRVWSLAATAALGLSLAGMTLTSGAVAKASLKAAIVASGAPSAAGIVSALSLAAVGTTLLMARVWWLAAGSGQAAWPRLGSSRTRAAHAGRGAVRCLGGCGGAGPGRTVDADGWPGRRGPGVVALRRGLHPRGARAGRHRGLADRTRLVAGDPRGPRRRHPRPAGASGLLGLERHHRGASVARTRSSRGDAGNVPRVRCRPGATDCRAGAPGLAGVRPRRPRPDDCRCGSAGAWLRLSPSTIV